MNGHFDIEVLDPQNVLVDRYVDPANLETAHRITHIHIFRTRKTVRGPVNAPLTTLCFSGAALQRELPCNQQRPNQLNDMAYAKNDPACCPTLKGKAWYKLAIGKSIPVKSRS